MSPDAWIQTYTGRKVFPLALQPDQIVLEDIAHALSLKCRFNGHCREFYSVAQHSVLVSEVVAAEGGSEVVQLAALLHDAPEAYGPDFCQPVKEFYEVYIAAPGVNALSLASVRAAEEWQLEIIHAAFGLPPVAEIEGYAVVKQADVILLCTEQRDLMGTPPEPWRVRAPYLWNTIHPLPPAQARLQFLRRAERLRRAIQIAARVPQS